MVRYVRYAVVLVLLVGCHARGLRPSATRADLSLTLTSRAGPGWTWIGWPAAAGVTTYSVYRALDPVGPWLLRAATRGTSYTDRRVQGGTTYYYSVRPKVGDKLGPHSRIAQAAPASAPAAGGARPAAPTDLTARWYPGEGVELHWSDAATNETGYRVARRAHDATAVTALQRLPPNTADFIDRTVPSGERWVYRVYALAGRTVSPYSNAELVEVPLAAPKGLVAHALSASVVRLTWRPTSQLHTGYRVERRVGDGLYRRVAMLPPSAHSYDNRRLRSRTKYSYRILSTGKIGDSAYSNVATTVTRPMPLLGSAMKVPGECYRMGAASASKSADDGAHQVCLRPFSIDIYEVTNAQYLACVRAGACSAPAEWSTPQRPNYFTAASYASFPVVNVSWEQAGAYCRSRGKRLPTEAEWEYAARGGPGAARAPAEAPDCHFANIRGEESCAMGTVRVASYPPNLVGAYDMIGNVWEWTADYYDDEYYQGSPVTAPAGPVIGKRRVRRGGGWTSDARTALPENRAVAYAATNSTTGFRCAR